MYEYPAFVMFVIFVILALVAKPPVKRRTVGELLASLWATPPAAQVLNTSEHIQTPTLDLALVGMVLEKATNEWRTKEWAITYCSCFKSGRCSVEGCLSDKGGMCVRYRKHLAGELA